MINMVTAYTTEVDDVDDALSEIFEQLDLDGLSENSVGIVNCCPDFIDIGILDALSEKLPFAFVGATTMASATAKEYGMYGLSLTILTSDDVSFQTVLSAPLTAEAYEEPLSAAYQSALDQLLGTPALILAYLPLTTSLGGNVILKQLNKLYGGTPIFGTLAGDVSMTMNNCFTFCGRQSGKQAAALLLLHGEVNPRFILSSLPDKNVSQQKAIVTESDSNIVKKVNGVPLKEYLRSIGIAPRAESGMGAIQELFMVDYGNASKRVAMRVLTVLENGDAVFNNDMPQGVSIAIGHVNHDSVVETATDALRQILEGGAAKGALIYPCMSRYLFLAPDKDAEMRTVRESLNGKITFSLSYSGGEICPIYTEDGQIHNHLHGDSFIACVF